MVWLSKHLVMKKVIHALFVTLSMIAELLNDDGIESLSATKKSG